MSSLLRINDLSLMVHLGCTAEEREVAQEVRISAEFRFAHGPGAEETDLLRDTVCYAQASEAFRKAIELQTFQTVERIGSVALDSLKGCVPDSVGVWVRIHKVKPPVKGLLGGVFYEMERG